MRKIKTDDEVIVVAGRDKGKRGKVVKILKDDRLIVSGIQMVKKHQKPNPQAGVQGGIIDMEAPIQISNVALFNPATEKADKVSFKILEDGKKVRVFRSNGEAVDA
ncbi:MAG: large subunit ribosomal protein L24 [Candidatus Endobugula sp.]|jgi:large subunit ribosomal protein L24